MSAIVISLIKLLLLPPMGLLVLMAAGLVFYKRRIGLPMAAVALSLILILSLPFVVNKLAQYWECFPALQSDHIQPFLPQAIVVIGGGLERAASEYTSEWTVNTRTLVRLRYAAKLARETGLPVLVSGGKPMNLAGPSEAEMMASVLIEEFGASTAWLEMASRNTAENARLSRSILQQHGVNRIILVTQAYHMPRAASEFRKAGFEVLPAPTAFIGRTAGFSLFDWIPSVRALEQVYLLAHESVGMLWYRLRY